MVFKENTRRDFVKTGSAALAATAVSWNAKSYAAIVGANDRVRTAVIGCGDRMKDALIPAFLQNSKDMNFQFVAVSDIWNRRREEAAACVQKLSGSPVEANRRVDIAIDGKPFTSYILPTTLKKPTLYPLIDDEGVTVTRGYPHEPRPVERIDHPRHAGLWFNYGNANGFDFWNNSDAIKPENRSKMGAILQTKILSTKSGLDRGELVVESVWVTGENKQIIHQTTCYIFERRSHAR